MDVARPQLRRKHGQARTGSAPPDAASRAESGPPGLLEIQRTAGNAAAVELLRRSGGAGPVAQRQVVDEAPAEGTETTGSSDRPTLQQGSTGDDVKLLQMKLRHVRERAHDVDKSGTARIDGIFGPLTRKDVMDFQSDTGLKADGIAGPKTWDALDTIVPETPLESEELAIDAEFNRAFGLKQERKYDEAIAAFEAMLPGQATPERIGILLANIGHCHHQRGRFRFAVERYEQSLSARFNQEMMRAATLGRLTLARNNLFDESPAPDPEPPVPGQEEGEPAPGQSGGGIVGRDMVESGDSGDAPDLFKGKLANILVGWLPELPDGNQFDEAAVARTRAFQQAVGLPPTGVGDGTTWHALDSFSKPDVPFAIVGPLLTRGRAAFAASQTDPAAGLSQMEGARDEAKALGLEEIVKNAEGVIGRMHHLQGDFDEALRHYEIYLQRVMPSPPHYGLFLEHIRLAHAKEPPPTF
ncbi:MAG TPA: peptidoglycan-binding protein [Candidatus Limnocylindrales bacterium]|nr:peptidoglycan-binding protein [Candidatus Limnocylindrales bacterium]